MAKDEHGTNWKGLILLKVICCGGPLLLIVLIAAGGLAAVGAWLQTAWPFLLAGAALLVGILLWRRRTASCPTCALPGPAREHDHSRTPAGAGRGVR